MTQPMSDADGRLFLTFFPFFFVGLWMTISTILGLLSGWFALQHAFPRGAERPLLTLRSRSGSMGLGVAMSGILTLAACPSGLRVSIWRLFGPFQRPCLVPWAEIEALPRRMFFVPGVQLRFGRPTVGTLSIDARAWQRLAAFAPSALMLKLPDEAASSRRLAQGLALQWLAITLGAGTFFAVASRQMIGGDGAGGPTPAGIALGVCYGFPAIVFGIPLLWRWLRDLR